jgi:hypothetical protein
MQANADYIADFGMDADTSQLDWTNGLANVSEAIHELWHDPIVPQVLEAPAGDFEHFDLLASAP